MNSNSYSMELKEMLSETVTKNVCCRRALLFGLLYARIPGENEKIQSLISRLEAEFENEFNQNTGNAADINTYLSCPSCASAFIRGLFLSSGTISDPEMSYQLEFIIPGRDDISDIVGVLEQNGLVPKISIKRGMHVLYYKDSTLIEEFLCTIGANKAMFELMNAKIKKELRNNANRLANCDAANIKKTIGASQDQIAAIEYLRDMGAIESLPEQLKATAKIRLENPDLPLSELVYLHNEDISKSGINHRLNKIIKIAEELKKR